MSVRMAPEQAEVVDEESGSEEDPHKAEATSARVGSSSRQVHHNDHHRHEQEENQDRNSWFHADMDKSFTSSGTSRASRRRNMRADLSAPPPTSGIFGEILMSTKFQFGMGFCIICNAAVIGLETDNPGASYWEYVELFFLFVFSFEFAIRLRVFGSRYLNRRNPDIMWNIFDASIVTTGVTGTVLEHLHLIEAQRSGGFSTLLRVIRLLRVFRIFRLVRMLKQLYMLIFGFGIAAIATVWVTILFVVMLYVAAVLSVKLRSTVPARDAELQDLLQERFLTVRIAMFSLFELMLNPDLERYEALLGRSRAFTCFIIIFVIFGSFGMLALLTGVISEAMFEKNTMRMEEERAEREERRNALSTLCGQIFEDMMADEVANMDEAPPVEVPVTGVRSRRLSVMKKNLVEISMETLNGSIPKMQEVFKIRGFHFAHHDIMEVLRYVDGDHSGRISKNEYSHAICSISEGVQASTVLELHKSISKRANEVDKELDEMIVEIKHQDDFINRKLELIEENHEALEIKFDRLLTLMPNLEAEAKRCQEGQPRGSEKSETCCPTCLRESNNSVATLRAASRVDAFEAVVREMHHSVMQLLLQEKSRAHNAPRPPDRPPRSAPDRLDSALPPGFTGSSATARLEEQWSATHFELPPDPLEQVEHKSLAAQRSEQSSRTSKGKAKAMDLCRRMNLKVSRSGPQARAGDAWSGMSFAPRPLDMQAQHGDEWSGMSFEVPPDPFDQVLDQMESTSMTDAEDAEDADLPHWVQNVKVASQAKGPPLLRGHAAPIVRAPAKPVQARPPPAAARPAQHAQRAAASASDQIQLSPPRKWQMPAQAAQQAAASASGLIQAAPPRTLQVQTQDAQQVALSARDLIQAAPPRKLQIPSDWPVDETASLLKMQEFNMSEEEEVD